MWFCHNYGISNCGFAITRIHTQKIKAAVLFKIDVLYFHLCTLLFICIILAPIYNMTNNENAVSVSVLVKTAIHWLFVVLLVKLLLSLLVILINSYCFSKPTANCTLYLLSSWKVLSHFENLQWYCSNPWKQHSKQIKSIYQSLTSKLLKNWIQNLVKSFVGTVTSMWQTMTI